MPAPDLDLDDRPDQLWIVGGRSAPALGVRTASGATFSLLLNDGDGGSLRAVAQRLAGDRSVILLVAGPWAELLSVANCSIVRTSDARGEPYVFDFGFLGTRNTGVGCEDLGAGLQLVHLSAVARPDGAVDLYRTPVTLDTLGLRAVPGARRLEARGLPATGTRATAARGATCGPGAAVATG